MPSASGSVGDRGGRCGVARCAARGARAPRVSRLDYQEIADVLELDVGTVKSRLNRARAALRVQLMRALPDSEVADESRRRHARRYDLSAWEAPPPPADLADAVIDRMGGTDVAIAMPVEEHRMPRARVDHRRRRGRRGGARARRVVVDSRDTPGSTVERRGRRGQGRARYRSTPCTRRRAARRCGGSAKATCCSSSSVWAA